jgi:hypothetical protein
MIDTARAAVAAAGSTVAIESIQSRVMQEAAAPPAPDAGAITAEIVAVIEAAVAAFAGKKLRITSIKVGREAPARSTSWADQGRDIVHGSHNLVQRGR